MRRINYDSAKVNISVFIEQRDISFQNDISLKTMRLGALSLSWELKFEKNHETHCRIVSLDQLGSQRAIADLFVIIVWTSKNASKVHKLVSELTIVLIWNIQSPHEDNLSSYERYNIITSKAMGPMHAPQVLIVEREWSICDICCLMLGAFVLSRLIMKMSTPEWCICIT